MTDFKKDLSARKGEAISQGVDLVGRVGSKIDWRIIEGEASKSLGFVDPGEGPKTVNGLLREEERIAISFVNYLNRMARVSIDFAKEGNLTTENLEPEGVKALFERVFVKAQGMEVEELPDGRDFLQPEAFVALVWQCFEWKWARMVGKQRWKFLQKKADQAEVWIRGRIKMQLGQEVYKGLFGEGDITEERQKNAAREAMKRAGISDEEIEEILTGKRGAEKLKYLLLSNGNVPIAVVDGLAARVEQLEWQKK